MKNMIKALNELKGAFKDVNEEWENVNLDEIKTETKYPFEKSFDELTLEVENWADEIIEDIE